MIDMKSLPIEKYTTTMGTSNYDSFGHTESERKDIEGDKWLADYLNTKMASRQLYNQKQVKLRVYPLGNNKYALPRKVM